MDAITKPRSKRWLRRLLLVLAAIAVLIAVSLYGFSLYFLNRTLSFRVEKLIATPETYGLRGESVSLTSSDAIPLKAWWIPAEGSKPRGVVILLHGMDGMDASTLLGHAKFLHEAGYAAVALDMRAHGRSGGQRIGSSVEEPRDVIAALDWLRQQPQLAGVPVILLGISMGGATALRTAAARADVAAVVSVSAFCSVNQSLQEVFDHSGMPKVAVAIMMPFIRLALATLYRVWPGRLSTLDDIDRIPPRPILIAHGTADDQISVDNAYRLARAAGNRVQLWIVRGAGHGIYSGEVTSAENGAYRDRILTFLDSVSDQSR
jgi:alpha-beta hydrolase superfamily lysophospholipase